MIHIDKVLFFSNWQLHKFTVYTTDDEDLPKGPPPAGSDLGKCQRWYFLFFYNAMIPQNAMHL